MEPNVGGLLSPDRLDNSIRLLVRKWRPNCNPELSVLGDPPPSQGEGHLI